MKAVPATKLIEEYKLYLSDVTKTIDNYVAYAFNRLIELESDVVAYEVLSASNGNQKTLMSRLLAFMKEYGYSKSIIKNDLERVSTQHTLLISYKALPS